MKRGGNLYLGGLFTDDALDAAIAPAAYLADPLVPMVLEIGKVRLHAATTALANAFGFGVLGQEDVTPPRRRNAVRTEIILGILA